MVGTTTPTVSKGGGLVKAGGSEPDAHASMPSSHEAAGRPKEALQVHRRLDAQRFVGSDVPHRHERLCALVPRPGTHRVRYHGVFASASPYRSLIVPTPLPTPVPSANPDPCNPDPNSVLGKRRRVRRLLWAELLKRTFVVDPKQCSNCGRQMKRIATIMRADVVKRILDAQGLPAEAPFIPPCRGPPSGELFEVWWR